MTLRRCLCIGDRERLEAVLTPLRIACALTLILTSSCLGSLFLGRVSDRRREFATRLALGAGQGRIVRLAGFEMLLVGLAGAVLAWFAAHAVLRASGALVISGGITVADAVSSIGARALADFAAVVAVAIVLAAAAPLVLVARVCARPGSSRRGPRRPARRSAGCSSRRRWPADSTRRPPHRRAPEAVDEGRVLTGGATGRRPLTRACVVDNLGTSCR